MEKREVNRELESILLPVCESLSLRLIEISMRKSGNSVDFSIVIDKNGGVSTDDCAQLHRTLFLKLQTMYDKEIGLEISSPGLDRALKYEDEFSLFIGRRVRWLQKGEADYLTGTIVGFVDRIVIFQTVTGEQKSVSVEDVLKARLNG